MNERTRGESAEQHRHPGGKGRRAARRAPTAPTSSSRDARGKLRLARAVAAAVVLRGGATADPEELREWVRARLRSTKTPQLIQVRAEMPYNETGKLLRRVIKEELAASS